MVLTLEHYHYTDGSITAHMVLSLHTWFYHCTHDSITALMVLTLEHYHYTDGSIRARGSITAHMVLPQRMVLSHKTWLLTTTTHMVL